MRAHLPLIVLAQLVLTSFLCGLIWVVQGVVYPLLTQVGPAEFSAVHAAEMYRIAWIVVPFMSLELLLTLTSTALAPRAVLAWAAGLALAGVWASTAFLQVPLHQQLAQSGYDARALDRLIDTNWFRTVSWTVRLALLWAWVRRLRPAAA